MQVKKFEAKTMKEALELVKVHLGPEAIILSAKDNSRGFGLMGQTSVEVTAAVSEETLRRKKIAETKLREDLRRKFHQIPASQQKQFINKVFENNELEMVTAGAPSATGSGVSPGGGARKPQPARAPQVARVPQARSAPAAKAFEAEDLKAFRGMRYIDIDDEMPAPKESSAARVRSAAQRARDAGHEVIRTPPPAVIPQKSVAAAAEMAARASWQLLGGAAPVVVPALAPSSASALVPIASVSAPTGSTQASLAAPVGSEMTAPTIRSLESQIGELRSIIERFQKMPQVPLNVHAGAELGVPFELSRAYSKLTAQGMHSEVVLELLKSAQKEMDAENLKKPALVDAFLVSKLLGTIQIVENPCAARYQVFMGCTGQGKTTSLVKMASHLVLKEKKRIAIVSMDTFKVGAADQLRIYAQILNVPFAIVKSPEDWKVAEQKLAKVHHILVDCPGFNLARSEEVEWLRRMLPPAHLNRSIHFVQSALARDIETMDIAARYNMVGFHDVIFTRLDESSAHGLILNFQHRFKVPIHSFGIGSRVPEDLEFATKERVVDLIFKLSKGSRKEEGHE